MRKKLFNSLKNISVATISLLVLGNIFLPQVVYSTDNTNDTNNIIPKLWGIDEDDGQLFSLTDYTTHGGFEDYGQLKWDNNGIIEVLETNTYNYQHSDIEAMTLDVDGTMYMALDRILPGVNSNNNQYCSTLLTFNILDAKLKGNGDNIVNVIDAIKIPCDHHQDNISGLSIDPSNGELVALLKDYDSSGNLIADKLYIISKTDGSLVDTIGSITGLQEQSDRAEDIEFSNLDADGNTYIYVTDDYDDHTYKVDPVDGTILTVIDNNQTAGLGVSQAKFEALGWDFANNRLAGYDDNNDLVANLTLEAGNNINYGQGLGLTDVEGIDFVPTPDGNPIITSDNNPTPVVFAD